MIINTVNIIGGEVVRNKINVDHLIDIEFVLEDGRRVNVRGDADMTVNTPDGTLIVIPEASNQITIQVRGYDTMVVNEENGDVRAEKYC